MSTDEIEDLRAEVARLRNEVQSVKTAKPRMVCKKCKGSGQHPGLLNACGRCWGTGYEAQR